MEGKDDGLVNVKPMLERITNWSDYLRDEDDDPSEIARLREHTQTGRPLGGADFIEKLEIVTGRVLARQKPGRKQKENTK
jgi:putative transposase